MIKPLCFVVMPFGQKKDTEGNIIDFDIIYNFLIKPAIEDADLEPIRADEETVNGIIHKPMYERLILCDYAVADLTTANANVFYELGIRHAVKPFTTVTIFSSNSKLPFDLNFVRCLPYEYDQERQLTHLDENKKALKNQLINAKNEKTTDSPIYQLVDGISFQNSVAHEKTDVFRDRVDYNNDLKKKFGLARKKEGGRGDEERLTSIDGIIDSLVLENEEAGVLIDAMLSYRAVGTKGAYEKMVGFIETIPRHVKQTVMVQEQLGFALNRLKRREEAIAILEKVLNQNGPSSETYGILGRVYKDLFDEAQDKNQILAESYLDKALEMYLKGFEADWRDAYPGVNAVTLLDLKGDRDEIKRLAPVVEYAVLRKIEQKKPDYWDYATLLELAVIENNEKKALENLKKAIATKIEGPWMIDTTIKNMNLIKRYRESRQEQYFLVEKVGKLLEEQKF